MLLKDEGTLIGFVMLADFMVVAVEGELLLLTPGGRLIERLAGIHGVPAGMQAVGLDRAGRLVVRASHGDYIVDEDFLAWRDVGTAEAQWSVATALPEGLYRKLAALYRGSGLSMERLLLDLHSGRLLGALSHGWRRAAHVGLGGEWRVALGAAPPALSQGCSSKWRIRARAASLCQSWAAGIRPLMRPSLAMR